MTNKTYKDLLATGIVFGLITFPVSVVLFAEYASHETKRIVGSIIIGCLCLVVVFVLWKAIRLLID